MEDQTEARLVDVTNLAAETSIFVNKIYFGELTNGDGDVSSTQKEDTENKGNNAVFVKTERDRLAEAHLVDTLGIDYGSV